MVGGKCGDKGGMKRNAEEGKFSRFILSSSIQLGFIFPVSVHLS